MRPADPDRGKASKSPPENKGRGGAGQKAAIQQWQMDLLLHEKLCLTLEKCISYLQTTLDIISGGLGHLKPLRGLWVLD